jgi:putative transposase
MTQNSDPNENSVADSINGVLKQEFKIDEIDIDIKVLKELMKDSVETYNTKCQHTFIYFLTPEEMHK